MEDGAGAEGGQGGNGAAGATSTDPFDKAAGLIPSAPPDGQGTNDGGGEGEPPKAPETWAKYGHKSVDELVNAFGESSQEGLRLHRDFRESQTTWEKERNEFLAQIEELKADTESRLSFKALTDKELEELKASDPAKYLDYRLAKDKFDAKTSAEKAQRESMRKESLAKREKTVAAIRAQTREMRDKPNDYPGYAQLLPVMNALLEIEPELAERASSPKLLYFAAKGLQSLRGERSALKATAEEKARAEAEAKARALAGGPTAGPKDGSPAGKGLDPFNAAIVAAGASKILPNF